MITREAGLLPSAVYPVVAPRRADDQLNNPTSSGRKAFQLLVLVGAMMALIDNRSNDVAF
jgi:hypothetical protein